MTPSRLVTRTVVDEVQTAFEGEPPMLREVQDDGLAVDTEADVLDAVCIRLTLLIRILYLRS